MEDKLIQTQRVSKLLYTKPSEYFILLQEGSKSPRTVWKRCSGCSLCVKAIRVPVLLLIVQSGMILSLLSSSLFNCTGTISHPPANSSLQGWQWTENIVPATLSPSKGGQRAVSAVHVTNALHGLGNRNPVQAQPNPLLRWFSDRCVWNHSLQGAGIFLQATLRTKQAEITTASTTDNTGVQQLDWSSHLCAAFPSEFLPDPAGQRQQTFMFPNVKHFLKHGFLFPVPAQICASITAGSSTSCSVSLLLRAF